MKEMKVVVLGAGMIGTTSAFRLKRTFPNLEMTLLAAEFSPFTTSDISAGYWEPHLDPDTPPALVTKWAGETYRLLANLASGRSVESLGSVETEMRRTVRRVHGTSVDSQEAETPAWAGEVSQYRTLSKTDIEMLGPATDPDNHEIYGDSFLSFTWEPSKALPLFYSWLGENGVKMVRKKVKDISEVEADLIINCTGLGSSWLLGDVGMFPVSGHVCRVKAGWVGDMISDNREDSWAYVIPNTETVVLGSVDRENNWDTEPREEDRQKIIERCDKLYPGVKVSKAKFELDCLKCTYVVSNVRL